MSSSLVLLKYLRKLLIKKILQNQQYIYDLFYYFQAHFHLKRPTNGLA